MCAVDHRQIDWASRPSAREFEFVITIEVVTESMVGSDQVPPERLPASLGRGSRGTVQRSDNDSRVDSLDAGVLLRSAWGEEPKAKAAKERISTALRFASFPVPLWGTGRVVKG